MNIRGLIIVAALAAVPTGCAANSSSNLSSVSPSMPLRTASRPQILQNGVQWVDLTPNLTVTSLFGIATGSDGAMWTVGGVQAARYTMARALKRYTLNVTGPNGLGTQFNADIIAAAGTNLYANGQDGGWGGGAVFAVITPKHVVNVYGIPSGDTAQGNEIAYDPANQTVWLGEGYHLGEINTTTNAITEYPDDAGALAVAYGPDGNIWTYGTQPSALTVWNPSTGAVLATYPFSCGFLYSLAAGSDGNLYGAGAGCGNFLAKITTAGVVTRVTLPNVPAANPQDIARVGVGFYAGHVEVNEHAGHDIDDYDPATGVLTQLAAPSQYAGDSPYAIAAGPDGNLWTTDYNGDVLVYVVNLITANPSSITVGVGNTVLLTASEPDGYRLKATSNNTAVATVTKITGGYDVKGVGAGTCTITLKDNIFNSLKVPVTVQ